MSCCCNTHIIVGEKGERGRCGPKGCKGDPGVCECSSGDKGLTGDQGPTGIPELMV